MTTSRSRIPIFAFIALAAAMLPAEPRSLLVERNGDHLRVSAPHLHFLEGKAGEKLRNGSTITYSMTLTAVPKQSGKPLFQMREKFTISFDLWEEKYSVVQNSPGGRSASRLSAAMTEAWFLENMPIPVRAIPEQQSFVIRLECSVEEDEADENGENPSGLTLAALIEVFSRKGRDEPLKWEAIGGPFRLSQLKEVK